MDFRKFAKRAAEYRETLTAEQLELHECFLRIRLVRDKSRDEAIAARDLFNSTAKQLNSKKRAVVWQHPINELFSILFSDEEGMVELSGDTYPHKDKIKAAGGVYTGGLGWKVPADEWERLSDIVGVRVKKK